MSLKKVASFPPLQAVPLLPSFIAGAQTQAAGGLSRLDVSLYVLYSTGFAAWNTKTAMKGLALCTSHTWIELPSIPALLSSMCDIPELLPCDTDLCEHNALQP